MSHVCRSRQVSRGGSDCGVRVRVYVCVCVCMPSRLGLLVPRLGPVLRSGTGRWTNTRRCGSGLLHTHTHAHTRARARTTKLFTQSRPFPNLCALTHNYERTDMSKRDRTVFCTTLHVCVCVCVSYLAVPQALTAANHYPNVRYSLPLQWRGSLPQAQCSQLWRGAHGSSARGARACGPRRMRQRRLLRWEWWARCLRGGSWT